MVIYILTLMRFAEFTITAVAVVAFAPAAAEWMFCVSVSGPFLISASVF